MGVIFNLLQGIQYTPDANYNGTDTIQVTISDSVNGVVATGIGAATSSSVSIPVTVTPVNDAPVITGTYTHSVNDTSAWDAFADITGTLVATDVDVGDTLTWSGSASGAYGSLTVNANGAYAYAANASAVNALQAGNNPVDSFVATVTDSMGAAATTTITVNVHGANDAALIGGTAAGSVTESGGVNNSTPGSASASGTLTDADVDNWWNSFSAKQGTTALGGVYSVMSNGSWSYMLSDSNASVDALNAARTLIDTFTAATIDGTTQTVSITIHGANDAAVISGTTAGSVTEAGGANNSIVGTPTASGALTDADVDNPANTFTVVSTPAASSSGYGTFTIDGTGHWAYALDNTNTSVQALGPGQSMSDTFTVHTIDGTAQQILVTIHGAEDLPAGAVAIGGSVVVGQTLTAMPSISDPEGLGAFSYQWQANGVDIGSATASSYTLASADAGKLVSCIVSYTDGSGTAEHVTGAAQSLVGVIASGGGVLIGSNGGDQMYDGSVRATMEGGLGNDTYHVTQSGDVIVENPNEGIDSVIAAVSFALPANVENLTLSGTGKFTAKGNELDNVLVGNSANNAIYSMGGNDTITGGAGADTFVLAQANMGDVVTITDFGVAQGDKINLSAIDANEEVGGNQGFRWIGTTSFSGYADQSGLLRFDAATATLVGSTNADGTHLVQIHLIGIDHIGTDAGGIGLHNIVL
jgi:VCBS repeat-containing protein